MLGRLVVAALLAWAGSGSAQASETFSPGSSGGGQDPSPSSPPATGHAATLAPAIALAIPQWSRLAPPAPPGGSLATTIAQDPFSLGADRSFSFDGLPVIRSSGFSDQLVAWMTREAGRFQREGRHAASNRLAVEDSAAEADRAAVAETIITRSFRRTIDRRLEALAEMTPGIGGVIAWAQGLGTRGSSGPATAGTPATPAAETAPTPPFRGSFRLKLDAHPKIQLGGEFCRIRGHIDLPLLAGDPLRLSLERAVGARGRAVLTSGLGRDGRDSTVLSLSFSY